MQKQQEQTKNDQTCVDIMVQRRSIRRFKQTPIPLEFLQKMVSVARVAPSAANLQPLEYIVIHDAHVCDQLFPTMNWAAYLSPKWSPPQGERPVAYILIVSNTEIAHASFVKYDVGLAAENIMIAAEAEDVGSCMLCSFHHEEVRNLLQIPPKYALEALIALGYKQEQPEMVPLEDSIKYWRDDKDVLHVPKRPMNDIIHYNSF
jgi:nitroreductase